MRQLLLCTTFLFTTYCSDAQTAVSGGMYANTSFSASGSPYIVTGDLTVYEGVTLTLDPGVEIMVDSGKAIFIRGSIIARGSANAPIYVHGHTTTHSLNFWTGFVFGAGGALGTHADFDHCNISNASYCFDLDLAYGGPYWFRNSSYSYNASVNRDGGLGGTFFDSCTFSDNFYGLTHFQYGGKVSNCVFDRNAYGTDGMDTLISCRFTNHTQTAVQTSGYMAGCEIYGNNVGVECSFFNGAGHTFINNKVKSNSTGVRIKAYAGGSIAFTGNEICGNSQYNVDMREVANCDLSLNCWCLSDSAAIHAKILDGPRAGGKGLVNFVPFNTGCLPYLQIESGMVATAILGISPNPLPARTSLHLTGLRHPSGKNSIIVQDVTGRSISFEAEPSGNTETRLRFNFLPPGLYSIIVTEESGPRIARFLALE